MRALQLNRRHLNPRFLLMLQGFLPLRCFNAPSLTGPDAHLLEVDAAAFRREVEKRLRELGSDGRLRVAEAGLED